KQLAENLQNASENPTESIVSTTLRRKCDRSGIGQEDDSDLVTFTLSSKLERTVINIREGSIIRQYRANNLKKEGRISYYVCQTCDLLKRKGANIVVPKIRVRYKRIVGDTHPPHAEQCLGISEEKMLAIAEDREARLRVREGLQLPRNAFNEGFERTVRSAANSQELSKRMFSVSTKYPLWKNVRRSYYRAKKHAKTKKRNEAIEQNDANIANSAAMSFQENYGYPNEHSVKAETSGEAHESRMAHDYDIALRQGRRSSVNEQQHFVGDCKSHEMFLGQHDDGMLGDLVDSSSCASSFNSNNHNQATDKCSNRNLTQINELNNSRTKTDHQYEGCSEDDELINVVTIENEQTSNMLTNERSTTIHPLSSNILQVDPPHSSSNLSLFQQQQHQFSPTTNTIIQSRSSASYSSALDAVNVSSSNPSNPHRMSSTRDPLICHALRKPTLTRNEINISQNSQLIDQQSLVSQNDALRNNTLNKCKSQTDGDHDNWTPPRRRIKISDGVTVDGGVVPFTHPDPAGDTGDGAIQRYDSGGQVTATMTVKEFLTAKKTWNKSVDETNNNPVLIDRESVQSTSTNQRITNETSKSSYAVDRLSGIGQWFGAKTNDHEELVVLVEGDSYWTLQMVDSSSERHL
ncbi:unnamed protein product, partial [Anisakis simplex]|uniref:Polycomb protein Asx n=1 Tax=Anisakis simplex TaxID=6269 RepID=A0A0M3KAV5_ANISI